MPRANVEAVQRWLECYNARDVEGMLAVSDPAIEFRSVFVGSGLAAVFRGAEGIRRYFEELADAYESFQVIATEYIDAGAGVLVLSDAVWRGRGSGADGSTAIFPAFWLRARKVILEETFAERAEAFAALGLDQ